MASARRRRSSAAERRAQVTGVTGATEATIPASLGKPGHDPLPAKQQIRILSALWPYLQRYSGSLILALLALSGAALATLAIPFAIRRLIDLGMLAPDTAYQAQGHFLVLLLLALLLAFCSAARYYLVTRIGERVVSDLRKQLYLHVIRLGPNFYEKQSVGDLLLRLNTDTTLIQTVVGGSLSVALRSMIILLGALVMLLFTSLHLGGAILMLIPFVVFPIVYLGRQVRRLSRVSQDRLADSGELAAETLHAVQTVQILNMEMYVGNRFSELTEQAFYAACARTRIRAILTAVAIFVVLAAIILVLWIGVQEVIIGDMGSGELGQFLLYSVLLAGSAGGLSEIWGDLQRAAGAMERLLELFEVDVERPQLTRPFSLPESGGGDITFQDLNFHYRSRPQIQVLRDVSLHIAQGETIALVGANGAGKTTLFRLLLRLYDPDSGHILVDGLDIAKVPPSEVRSRISLVPQEIVLFTGSILDNIRYSRPEADEGEVVCAARTALVDEFAETLPEGYDTPLGEQGVRLSGGQRQRIAIARAILKDPSVMLLDEATSSLDVQSGRLVQRALERLMQGRTTLVIAHQLATVERVDRIIVMDRGRIAAEGSHAELMSREGLYRRLVEMEFTGGQGQRISRQQQASGSSASRVHEV